MNQFLRIYLPCFILGYLLVSFVWPTLRVYRKTGINPLRFGNTTTAHDYVGFIMKLLTGLFVVNVFVFSISPVAYEWLVPIPYLRSETVQLAGLLLAHGSLLWIVLAQQQMNNSWRIGIDEENKTALVTEGLFRVSRNPVFLGMLGSVAGLFLVLPNLLSFSCMAATYIVIQVQIRLEEAFLEQAHGALYRAYKKTVRRLL